MNTPDPCLPGRDGPDREKGSYPIGFKAAVALTALYLLYRLGQGVVWLASQLLG